MHVSRDVTPRFSPAFRARLAELFAWRRDVRRFRPDPVAPALVRRLLAGSALAPSVGLSEPWRFVMVESETARAAARANFEAANAEALSGYSGAQARRYAGLKLSGMREAPVQVAVFCDEATRQGAGLGLGTMPEMRRYSVVCAVMQLWLATRSEGLGLGWVSILDPERLARDLDLPQGWRLVAYLCLGWPEEDHDDPELAHAGWEARHAPEILTR
ncbi:MAG TPA: 5,6-dimethylbenzimidazole synthase [Thermohalobaculum sp.]|nr:5,6-dimethylbenzimidazole synthase [Thermohalobaculum sp.]